MAGGRTRSHLRSLPTGSLAGEGARSQLRPLPAGLRWEEEPAPPHPHWVSGGRRSQESAPPPPHWVSGGRRSQEPAPLPSPTGSLAGGGARSQLRPLPVGCLASAAGEEEGVLVLLCLRPSFQGSAVRRHMVRPPGLPCSSTSLNGYGCSPRRQNCSSFEGQDSDLPYLGRERKKPLCLEKKGREEKGMEGRGGR